MLTTTLDAIEHTRVLSLGIQPVEYGPPGDHSVVPAILAYLQSEPPGALEPSKADAVRQSNAEAFAQPVISETHERDRWKQVNDVVEAHRLLLAGNLQGSRATIARARERYGETALFLGVDGIILAREGKTEESANVSRHVLQQFRDEISRAEEATHEWAAGNLPQALAKSVETLSGEPGNVLAWLVRGALLLPRNPEKALRNVDTALDVFLRLYQAWGLRLRAQLLLQLQQADQALQAASASIEISPHSAWAYDTRSSVLLKLNRNTEALQDLDTAIRLAPEWPEPERMKTAVLADLKHNEEAIAAATAALKKGGEDSLMYEIRATCLFQLRQYRAAAADIRKARELDPQSSSIAALAEQVEKSLKK